MEQIIILAQLTVSISVIVVWVFRRDNIDLEFQLYKLSNLTKNIIGALKISLATVLILGIWYPELLLISSLSMAFLMLCAQYFHFRAKNPWYKYIPSLLLLTLSLLIAYLQIELYFLQAFNDL